ncbi:MAG: hypothetical protein WAT22_18205 [Saprospiraceae bacterium]|jgi:hypothetical protein|nr:hypothetical protein [Saprospiraceae bacterium]MBK9567398.1 hypothetical protein [Saprospiraceae bacterium]MBP6447222.1 hypothetical protein [Saprospiraceae bacterium]
MRKRIAIYPALVCSFLLNIYLTGQVPSQEFAEKLYATQQYEYALKEYLRVYFVSKDNSSDLLIKISNLYAQLNNPEKSLKYADLYFFGNEDWDKKNDAIRSKILVHLKNEDYESALVSANQLKDVDIESADNKRFYIGLCQLLQKTPVTEDNELLFLTYLTDHDKRLLSDRFTTIQKLHQKNPYTAMFYSAMVPGLGQALNGDTKDGLKSLALMVALGAVFIEVSTVLSLGDAIISVSPWLIRYFAGGMINASKIAKERIKHKKGMEIQEILKHLAQK